MGRLATNFEDHQPYHCRDCSCSWCDRCRCCRCKRRINLQGYVVLANAIVEILHALLNNLCALSCSDRCCRLLDGIPTNCCIAHVLLACLRRIRLCFPIHPVRGNFQSSQPLFFHSFCFARIGPSADRWIRVDVSWLFGLPDVPSDSLDVHQNSHNDDRAHNSSSTQMKNVTAPHTSISRGEILD